MEKWIGFTGILLGVSSYFISFVVNYQALIWTKLNQNIDTSSAETFSISWVVKFIIIALGIFGIILAIRYLKSGKKTIKILVYFGLIMAILGICGAVFPLYLLFL